MPGDCMGELLSHLLSESVPSSVRFDAGWRKVTRWGRDPSINFSPRGAETRRLRKIDFSASPRLSGEKSFPDVQARMPIPLRGTIPQMHFRRFAAFLLGIWIGGSAFMDMVATQNFHSVDRLLAAPSPQAEE